MAPAWFACGLVLGSAVPQTVFSTVAVLLASLCLAVLFGQQAAAFEPQFPWLDTSLPVKQRVKALVSRLSPEQKVAQLQTDPFGGIPELQVPDTAWQTECMHGVKLGGSGYAAETGTGLGGTNFPQNLAQAATFDDALIQRMTGAISDEMRALHNEVVAKGLTPGFTNCFSPHIAIVRDPRWGRLSETFGEDPLLQSGMSVAFVRGLQRGARTHIKVGATCKHFLGHDIDRWGNHSAHNWNAVIDPRHLRDTHLPHFEACAREAGSVMCAFNAVDGLPSCANGDLLSGVLRRQLGFKGVVVTDNRALVTMTTPSPTGLGFAGGNLQNASALTVKAGADMFMKTSGYLVHADLAPAELDAAVRRVLTLRTRLGHFDPPESLPWASLNVTVIGSPQHLAIARAIAAKGTLLLKNERCLPLDPARIQRLAVIGPFSDQADYLLGRGVGATAGPTITPLAALREALPGAEVTFDVDTAYLYSEENVGKDAAACEAADA